MSPTEFVIVNSVDFRPARMSDKDVFLLTFWVPVSRTGGDAEMLADEGGAAVCAGNDFLMPNEPLVVSRLAGGLRLAADPATSSSGSADGMRLSFI